MNDIRAALRTALGALAGLATIGLMIYGIRRIFLALSVWVGAWAWLIVGGGLFAISFAFMLYVLYKGGEQGPK